jgi:hypothetical protein
MNAQSLGSPNRDNFETPLWESREKVSSDASAAESHIKYYITTRNFGFCNCRMQLKFSCMRHMQVQICVVA